jgi:hypothetical protein
MTREEIILSHIERDGLGLEIGAGCAPIAPKKHGFRVHVLEHNLIGFLNDCDSLLKKDGVLSLAVPDKRYCFDSLSTFNGHRARHRCLAQSAKNSFGRNGGRIFSDGSKQRRPHCLGRGRESGVEACAFIGTGETSDPDCGRARHVSRCSRMVFTPTSFRLMMRDLFELGFLQLKELAFHPSQGSEFYIALSRAGARLDLLQEIHREQSVP